MSHKLILLSGMFAAFLATAGYANASFGPIAGDSSILSQQKNEDDQIARRGRGADDGPGHTRRCRGCDDGPNHTLKANDLFDQLARRGRGADDPAGHQRGGHGTDDGPNHS